jgi:EAL domain-containing protein (putative c-di-GMP-specific phosphodiesterase class I)
VRLGLEHAGERLAQIDLLFEAGLDYVKLDASVTRGVASDTSRAGFVKTSATLLHGLSLQVYAEGVASEEDMQTLWTCGVDGVTGPWVTQRNTDTAKA